jgi:GR25 family glycosyltransferase involved in LPS biosynthesis
MKKFCHKVLSNEEIPKKQDDLVRLSLKNQIEEKLKRFSEPINSKTIFIKNEDDLKNFYLNNKDIKINPNGYLNVYNNQGWKFGELGIWASNLLAWKDFAKSNYDYLIIFEDDIKLLKNFTDLLPKYIDSLPNDWELLGLYSTPLDDLNYKKEYDIEKNNFVCHSFHYLNLAAYVINKHAIFKILEKIKTPINEPIDVYLFTHPRKFNSFDIRLDAEKIVKRNDRLVSTFQNHHKVLIMKCLEDKEVI